MSAPQGRPLTHLVLFTGVLLRTMLAAVTPANLAYDNHFEPIEILLREGRLPSARDCWQCYQPPLYYVISAAIYRSAEGLYRSLSGSSSDLRGAQPAEQHARAAARKAVQFVSVVAGCATLYVCLLIVRRACRPAPRTEALAVALPALLPQHVYMSAMVTNDALTYLMASLAIHAALRAHAAGWPLGRSALAGALGGSCVLSKTYGLVTALLVVASPALAAVIARVRAVAAARSGARRADPPPRGAVHRTAGRRDAPPPAAPPSVRPAVLAAAAACTLVGVWPAIRNLALYGRAHVDNFELRRTGMHTQPPGSVAAIDFLSLRFVKLMEYPWVHRAHVDSFWTELYARFWFDYEGIMITLRQSPEWAEHSGRALRTWGGWTPQAWDEILRWTHKDVPADLARAARLGYLAGLPLTLAVLAGAGVAARRALGELPAALLVLHLLGSLFIPVFQTLRLPYFAAMKAAFALGGLSSAAACLAFLLESLSGWAAAPAGAAAPGRTRRGAALAVETLLWLGVLGVLGANLLYLSAQYARVA
jgi:hypothetical protein